MDTTALYQLAYNSLLNLATDDGINASAKNEVFGCIFGRDSAITVLKILKAHKFQPAPNLLPITKRTLLTLVSLQGKEVNLESGEQPGKFIHEFRKTGFEHLTTAKIPWYIYPDNVLRNYDSIDSTPLTLIALYKYWQATKDQDFLITILPAVEMGLNWIITYGDIDKDYLIEYDLPKNRHFGGLSVHSWTDSHESLIQPDGKWPEYPIAPIEVQSFAWLALRLWGEFYSLRSPKFAQKLLRYASETKRAFNEQFIFKTDGHIWGAQALDGNKNPIKTITANPLLCLWASDSFSGSINSILDSNLIEKIIDRAFYSDLFVKNAGIRTMSSLSHSYNSSADSYHNGSFWPMLNGLIIGGLKNFGFNGEANKLTEAALFPITHFGTPIELYIKDELGNLHEYCSLSGQKGCREQAWSAAAILAITAPNLQKTANFV